MSLFEGETILGQRRNIGKIRHWDPLVPLRIKICLRSLATWAQGNLSKSAKDYFHIRGGKLRLFLFICL